MRTLSPVTQADAYSALRNAGAGDTVKLGNIAMDSLTGGTAIAPGVTIEGGQFTRINGGWNKVKFLGPTLRPNGIGFNTTAIILHGDDCIIQGLDLDCRDGALWTVRDWRDRSTGGVMFYGHGCQLIGGAMYGVRTGFVAQHSSTGARVEGLRIKGISGDAFRPNGNGTRIALCYVTDTWAVDGNHDDMVQSFAIDPATGKPSNSYTDTVDDVQIVGNEFYSCDDPKNEIWSRTAEPGPINPDAVPLISAGQGIWMGDGAPQNWTVDGNLLVLTPWKHGISLGGAIGCRVTNNRVIDGNPRYRGEGLRIFVRAGNGNQVVGNEAPSVPKYQAHNREIPPSDYAKHYKDPARFDFRPIGSVPAPVPVPPAPVPPPVVVPETPVDEPQEPLPVDFLFSDDGSGPGVIPEPPTDEPQAAIVAEIESGLANLTALVAKLKG